jgi:hypothetical protein
LSTLAYPAAMRTWIFICLATLAVIVLSSPFLWSLVRMSWAAEPVSYIRHDGTVQNATIGPASWWPDWAVRPEGATVQVESHFEAAPDMPATGIAAVTLRGDQHEAVERYEADLRSHGFAVTRYERLTWSPDIPSRQFMLCMVEGVGGPASTRVIRLSFSVDSTAMPTKLFWMEGNVVPLIGMAPGSCFG